MRADRIERDILINAPMARVWALITQAEHLGTWFGDAGAEIDLREGGELELRWEKHGTTRGRIERVDEPTAFAFRWAPYNYPGAAPSPSPETRPWSSSPSSRRATPRESAWSRPGVRQPGDLVGAAGP